MCIRDSPYPMKQTVVRLVRTAIPVALGALAVNLSSLVDTTFVQRRLRDIMSVHPEVLLQEYSGLLSEVVIQTDRVPTFLFGCYGNATTLFMLVPAITQAFGVSALPNVTTAWTTGDPKKIKNSIETVLRVVAMITIPAGLGLSVLSGPITQLLGYNEITGKILILLGLGAIFAATDTPINSMLQAVGRVDLPIKLLSVGLVIKVVLNYLLVGIPEINVMGAGIGTLVCYFFLTVFGLVLLCRETKIKLNWIGLFVKPFLSGGVCVPVSYTHLDVYKRQTKHWRIWRSMRRSPTALVSAWSKRSWRISPCAISTPSLTRRLKAAWPCAVGSGRRLLR